MTSTAKNKGITLIGIATYVGLILFAVAAFLVVQRMGEGLVPPQLPISQQVNSTLNAITKTVPIVFHVLLTLTSVIAVGAILGRLCRFVGQPPVIGEVIAGILLGPSLLGAISSDAMHCLMPSAIADPGGKVAAAMKAISQLGVILYMFLVGLELDAARVKHRAHSAIAISHASIVIPFVLGAILALGLYPRFADDNVRFTSFALFIGVAMSITAFPVLARILTDRGLQNTTLGTMALGCAAADDVTAWCLLAFVVGVAKSEVDSAMWIVGGSMAFIVVMLLIVRPLVTIVVKRFDRHDKPVPTLAISGTFLLVLVSALITEMIGIHALFGAFLLGAVIPSASRFGKDFSGRLKDPVTVLLLPAFFAYTGMRTEIGLVQGYENWIWCILIVLVATVGKFGGTTVAARVTGETWRDSAALGTLMNTRGLMELIVLNIGLDMGIIPPMLFTMMVIMALATTIATAPILKLLIRETTLETKSQWT